MKTLAPLSASHALERTRSSRRRRPATAGDRTRLPGTEYPGDCPLRVGCAASRRPSRTESATPCGWIGRSHCPPSRIGAELKYGPFTPARCHGMLHAVTRDSRQNWCWHRTAGSFERYSCGFSDAFCGAAQDQVQSLLNGIVTKVGVQQRILVTIRGIAG